MDHAGSFRHACEAILGFWVGWESERGGEELGECVGGADGFGGGEPRVVCVVDVGVGRGDLGQDLLDG